VRSISFLYRAVIEIAHGIHPAQKAPPLSGTGVFPSLRARVVPSRSNVSINPRLSRRASRPRREPVPHVDTNEGVAGKLRRSVRWTFSNNRRKLPRIHVPADTSCRSRAAPEVEHLPVLIRLQTVQYRSSHGSYTTGLFLLPV
jgi:hypothetical protein